MTDPVISAEGAESNVVIRSVREPKGQGTIVVTTPPNPDWQITPKLSDGLTLVINGQKMLRFVRTEDGKLDIEYDPEELTEVAAAFVREMKRIVGVRQDG